MPTHLTRKRTLTKHLGWKRSWKDDFTETLYLTLPRKPMEMNKRLESPDSCQPKTNESGDILHRQVATGTCERKRRQNKGSGQAYTFFHTYIRYIIMDLIRIQQGVDSTACCSATAILYHCDGHFISLRKISNFRERLPIRENRENLGPQKLERVRHIARDTAHVHYNVVTC